MHLLPSITDCVATVYLGGSSCSLHSIEVWLRWPWWLKKKLYAVLVKWNRRSHFSSHSLLGHPTVNHLPVMQMGIWNAICVKFRLHDGVGASPWLG